MTRCESRKSPERAVRQRNYLELNGQAKWTLETQATDSVKQTRADIRSGKRLNQSRKRTVILDIPADNEIRPPTWEEAARKCVEVYQDVISKHKNCRRG